MDAKYCKNSVKDEENPVIRRCSVTGYICKPTKKFGGKYQCIFEPQYMELEQAQTILKLIKGLEPGMTVYFSFRTSGGTFGRDQIVPSSGQIRKIKDNGKLIIDSKQWKWPVENFSIHDLTRGLYLKKEDYKRILERQNEELENQERIDRELREDGRDS